MYERFIGAKSEPRRTHTEIAAAVKTDTAEAIKTGALPPIRVSVRTATFSGGRTIDLVITDTPFPVVSDDWLAERPDRINHHNGTSGLTAQAAAVLATVRDLLEAYNTRHSHALSDYHSCSFYGEVNYDPGLDARDYAAWRKRVTGVDEWQNDRVKALRPTLSLAAFLRMVKPGDSLILLAHADRGFRQRFGQERRITKVTASRIGAEGVRITIPKAQAIKVVADEIHIDLTGGKEFIEHAHFRWVRESAHERAELAAMAHRATRPDAEGACPLPP